MPGIDKQRRKHDGQQRSARRKQRQRSNAADNARCYVAKDENGALVGAIIGGIMGTRATLNHIAISPIFRNNKIGTVLTKTILNDFYLSGIKRVFLFIEDKNQVAFNFWRSQGFQPTTGETTCELDL